MNILLDTHYHLSFIENMKLRVEFLDAIREQKIAIVAQTILPSEFLALHEQFGETCSGPDSREAREARNARGMRDSREARNSNVLLSLGFHPWWVDPQEDMEKEMDAFTEALHFTPYIGEIGLDFSSKYGSTEKKRAQLEIFRKIIESILQAENPVDKASNYILSIHAVQSTTQVLDILEEYEVSAKNHVIPILHRFHGTSDELTRHIRLGGYLSVHPKTLATKRGRAYVQQVPGERLLLESDLPTERMVEIPSTGGIDLGISMAHTLKNSLEDSLGTLSALRQEDMLPIILATQNKLFQI